jgi:putative MATE family efflux protein
MGVIFVVIPMVGNNAIRACGDTLIPSIIMITSTIINVILDPLFIFGLWGFPRLELEGAAIATVIARAAAMIFSLAILAFKEKLIGFFLPPLKELIASLKQIFYIGIPTAASRILIPITVAIIMRLVAGFGEEAVAAFGVAVKIEMFVFMVIMALATALIPFVGQNWGAKNYKRVKEAIKSSNKFSFLWGAGSFVFFLALAIPMGYLFSKDPQVSKNITYYLWVMPVSYGMRSISFLVASTFNAINKPLVATGINLMRMFVFYIPFAWIGSLLGGLVGLFIGLCIANILAGSFSIWILHREVITR